MTTPTQPHLTPQSSMPRVLILGGGEIAKEIAFAFQSLGAQVLVADTIPDTPAAQVVGTSYVLDLDDFEQLSKLLEALKPNYVVPENKAVNVDALKLYSKHSGGVVPSEKALDIAFNREHMRWVASEELGLPTAAYAVASNFAELEVAAAQMGYPCVVKATQNSSDHGNSLVRSPEDLQSAWDNSGHQRIIVERFINFDVEITLLVARSIDPQTGKLATWFCEPIGYRNAGGQLVEAWQPIEISQDALDTARSVAARISNYIGGRGVFGVELFVAGNDVYFSGVAPRPHTTGLVTIATQRFNEFELHARAILGLPLDAALISPGACSSILADYVPGEPVPGFYMGDTGKQSTEITYQGVFQALSVPESDLRIFGRSTAFPGQVMGIGLATADDVDTARARAQEVAERVKITTTD